MRKSIIAISMLIGIFVLFPAISASAQGCSESRFVIEDEVSGQELGLIYTETPEQKHEICLQGEFMGKEYQYLYKCDDKSGTYTFIKKFKTHQKGCRWGKMR
ncbi:MAG: hypothetical protein IME98_04395 [Proteobacteria bacterium]|nr:hypothetical protein [Pseudomonadota bacterium]